MRDLRVDQILTDVLAQAADRTSVAAQAFLPGALCAACAAALPVTGVGLALMDHRGPAGLVAATDGVAILMEELQFSLGEGPRVDCSRLGRPVLQPELRTTGPYRWPASGELLSTLGSKPSSRSHCRSAVSASECSTSIVSRPACSARTR